MNAKIKLLSLAVLFPVLFSSCNNDPAEPIYRSIGTVINPDSVRNYMIISDRGSRLKPTNASLILKDGQRILADFYILNEHPAENDYDYDIQYVDLYQILTKDIFEITPETQDSIGNDAVGVYQMWIGSNYLNVEFYFGAYNKKHFINLVSDSAKTYNDGKVHLEFRHNSNNDHAAQTEWGLASFDLRSLEKNAVGDSVNIVVHSREYGSTEEKTRELTYKFNSEENTTERTVAIRRSAADFE